jgi:hypothetical protein
MHGAEAEDDQLLDDEMEEEDLMDGGDGGDGDDGGSKAGDRRLSIASNGSASRRQSIDSRRQSMVGRKMSTFGKSARSGSVTTSDWVLNEADVQGSVRIANKKVTRVCAACVQ